MRKLLLIVAFFCVQFGYIAVPVHASDMTIEQAYRALNHKQTTFSKLNSRISEKESEYLDHLFFVTDLAFRERMVMLRYFQAGTSTSYITAYNDQIQNLQSSFDLISPPNRSLKKVEHLILSAIKEQKNFFNEWHKSKGTQYYRSLSRNYASHRLVQSSHKKLIQAYAILKRQYPREHPHNQQSFYDHLCALDFI